MAGNANFGVVLGKKSGMSYTTIGELVSIDPPEYSTDSVEVTNHGTSNRQYVASTLVGLSEFSCVVNFVDADVSALKTDLDAGTIGDYEISYPNTVKHQFQAFVKSIKPTEADSTNPDALQCEVKFQPTGALTVA